MVIDYFWEELVAINSRVIFNAPQKRACRLKWTFKDSHVAKIIWSVQWSKNTCRTTKKMLVRMLITCDTWHVYAQDSSCTFGNKKLHVTGNESCLEWRLSHRDCQQCAEKLVLMTLMIIKIMMMTSATMIVMLVMLLCHVDHDDHNEETWLKTLTSCLSVGQRDMGGAKGLERHRINGPGHLANDRTQILLCAKFAFWLVAKVRALQKPQLLKFFVNVSFRANSSSYSRRCCKEDNTMVEKQNNILTRLMMEMSRG